MPPRHCSNGASQNHWNLSCYWPLKELGYTPNQINDRAEAIYEQGKLKNQDRSKRALSLIEKEKNASADFLGSKVWKQKFSELEKRIKGGG